MGGFTGSDPAMPLTKLKSYIASGKLRYVLLDSASGGFGGGMGGPGGGQANSAATAYVKSTCTVVPASAYGAGSSTSSKTTATTATSGQTLYECTKG
jgi:hypothetical protein